MTTNSKPKKAATRKGSASKTRAQLRKELARDLAAILANPETPLPLYNAIADEVCDLSEKIDFHTPEMLERSVDAYYAAEAKRKGGAQ